MDQADLSKIVTGSKRAHFYVFHLAIREVLIVNWDRAGALLNNEHELSVSVALLHYFHIRLKECHYCHITQSVNHVVEPLLGGLYENLGLTRGYEWPIGSLEIEPFSIKTGFYKVGELTPL